MILDKKHLKHLAELARIELDEKSEAKFLQDLARILEHFKELEEVNTENVSPLFSGAELKNVARPDEVRKDRLGSDKAVSALPEQEGWHLKIPPVFE